MKERRVGIRFGCQLNILLIMVQKGEAEMIRALLILKIKHERIVACRVQRSIERSTMKYVAFIDSLVRRRFHTYHRSLANIHRILTVKQENPQKPTEQ